MPGETHNAFGATRLGFGCAGLHGAVSAREAAFLLETALDHGVSHFDTARVYGWGAAEEMLGALARRRRDEMTIVSKAGVAAPSKFGRAIAKLGGRFIPRLAAAGGMRFGRFAPAEVARSVEASLAALKTDRLDALLLHEVQPDHINDALVRTLSDLQQSGKVLRLGLATSAEASAAIACTHPHLCEVIQVAAPPIGTRALARVNGLRILHSVLGARLGKFIAALRSEPQRAARFAAETGCDPAAKSALASLLLRTAAREGMVLFSSTNPQHIAANAAALAAANDDELQGFDRFLAAA